MVSFVLTAVEANEHTIELFCSFVLFSVPTLCVLSPVRLSAGRSCNAGTLPEMLKSWRPFIQCIK